MPDHFYDNKIKRRLLRKRIINDNGCWLWIGYVTKSGYGQTQYGDKVWFVHRIAYKLFKDNFINDLLVCHKCDIPNCFNPEHLFQGTDRDNHIDAINKGRWKNKNSQKTHCKRGHLLEGENLDTDYRGNRKCIICYKNKTTLDNMIRDGRRASVHN